MKKHGIIQGYNGIAAADDKNQIIIAANAYGTVAEGQFFFPDEQFRNRDNTLKDGERRKGKERFDARHFKYMKKENCFICPNST